MRRGARVEGGRQLCAYKPDGKSFRHDVDLSTEYAPGRSLSNAIYCRECAQLKKAEVRRASDEARKRRPTRTQLSWGRDAAAALDALVLPLLSAVAYSARTHGMSVTSKRVDHAVELLRRDLQPPRPPGGQPRGLGPR